MRYTVNLANIDEEKTKIHFLMDVMVITIYAMTRGIENWERMEEYGKDVYSWLRNILRLPNGIPSKDTFERVFKTLEPGALLSYFWNWAQTVNKVAEEKKLTVNGMVFYPVHEFIPYDKTIYKISVYATENGVMLGQLRTDKTTDDDKTTAIPELIEILRIPKSIITIDATNCQRETANQIIKKGGDYLIILDDAYGEIYKEIQQFFSYKKTKNGYNFGDTNYSFYKNINYGPEQIEIRQYWSIPDISWLPQKNKWKGVKSIWVVELDCVAFGSRSKERRYYISSLESDAGRYNHVFRGHWNVGTLFHWHLDVSLL